MAHQIENNNCFFVGSAAWHSIGTVLDKPPTAEEATKIANMGWKANKVKMFLADGSEVPDNFAIVRDSDNSTLGVVGNRYTVLQNEEAFNFFDPLIASGVATYEAGGVLHKGRKVWILAKIAGDIEVGKDDVVEKYVVLSNTHDGSGTVIAKVTPIRVVCQNTLSAALGQNRESSSKKGSLTDTVTIRHTTKVGERTREASSLLKTINETYDKLGKVWQAMATFKMPATATNDYFMSVFPDGQSERSKKPGLMRAELAGLLSNESLGQTLDTTNGTLYGAYNAITARMEHYQSVRKGASPDKHLDSLWFGQRQQILNTAFGNAVDIMRKDGVSIDI